MGSSTCVGLQHTVPAVGYRRLGFFNVCRSAIEYRGRRNEGSLCWRSRAITGALTNVWSRSEYSFACFACSQDFCLFLFCFPASLNFTFPNLILQTTTFDSPVNRSFSCNLMTCVCVHRWPEAVTRPSRVSGCSLSKISLQHTGC